MKSLTAEPSRRNSGFDMYATPCRPRASSRTRTFSPVPTGTVDFITRPAPSALGGIASITACTRDRSASPDGIGGVSTQMNASRASANISSRSSVKRRRLRLRRIRSSRPGSCSGTSPPRSISTLAGSMSRQMTV